MQAEEAKEHIIDALDDLKARDIQAIFVGDVTSVADWMIIASGTSNRHVKSLGDHVNVSLKEKGLRPIGVEGEDSAEWMLVDFGDVVVHIMMPETRRFYDLESLWRVKPLEQEDIKTDQTES